jgi:lipopolysaccharide export system permease protein
MDGIYEKKYYNSMKKLLFTNFFKDILKFFIIISISIAIIVWVIQAVNYLDFVTKDGHGLKVYFSYTLFNFPKIFGRILPLIFFISLFYKLQEYEQKNELLIFWTIGINKLYFINMVIAYSFLFMVFQIILTSFITPKSQDAARSIIRNSNIDFFPSLIKEGKFIDTVKNLTIFIESKDENGNYKNIFLEDLGKTAISFDEGKSQIIYAKKGVLKIDNSRKYLELINGKIINKNNLKLTSFSFKKIDFNLSEYDSKSTTFPKIQELKSTTLFKCINYFSKDKKGIVINKYLNCNQNSIKHVKQEFFKRFYKPIGIPLVALLACLIILISKEHRKYNMLKFILFASIIFVIVVSETSLRYVGHNIIGTYFFILFPLTLFLTTYISLFKHLKN